MIRITIKISENNNKNKMVFDSFYFFLLLKEKHWHAYSLKPNVAGYFHTSFFCYYHRRSVTSMGIIHRIVCVARARSSGQCKAFYGFGSMFSSQSDTRLIRLSSLWAQRCRWLIIGTQWSDRKLRTPLARLAPMDFTWHLL